MTDLQEEPAIFQLIRNRDVSVDAIRLYLQHFPKSLQHPVYAGETILTIAAKECIALDSPDAINNEDINTIMMRQLSILSIVADFVDVTEIIAGQSIFHLIVQPSFRSNDNDEEVLGVTIAMYKLISTAMLDVLLKKIAISDKSNVLFFRNEESQLALHIAIFHDNHKAARKILEYMRLSCADYSYYEYLELDRKIPLLHYLLMHSNNGKLLSLIFSMFPDAASIADGDGVFPIAVALENSLSCRKIESIINKYPPVLFMANEDGDLPLHLAAMDCAHQFDVLQFLIEKYRVAMLTSNCNGQLPLHCCLEFQNHTDRDEPINLIAVQMLSICNPINSKCIDDSESTFDSNNTYDDSTNSKSIISSPVSTITNTVPYFEDEMNEGVCSESSLPDSCRYLALCHRDSYGEIPLHIACRRLTSSSFDIISWLLESYPESASSRNEFGHLPMHLLAASEVHKADTDTIERCFNLLLKAYPAAIYAQDNEGDIPLQCLLTHVNILPGLMRCLISSMTRITAENYYLMENPQTKHSPLHTACLNGIYTAEVMNELISLYPEALLHFDVDGLLPFHVALEAPHKCNTFFLKTLLYRPTRNSREVTCQQSTTLPCTADGTPALLFACENSNGTNELENDDDRKNYDCKVLDVIRFLVERSPELFIKHIFS